MDNYDLLMLIVLVGATIMGAFKGLVWQLASLASIGVSYLVAVNFRGVVAELIPAEHPWNAFAAMLVLYLGTSLLVWIGFRMIYKTIDELKLRSFDRQLGAIFGAAKGVVLCVVVTLFAVTLLKDEQRQTIMASRSGQYISQLLHEARGIMPAELQEVIEPYLDRLDERWTGRAADPDTARW